MTPEKCPECETGLIKSDPLRRECDCGYWYGGKYHPSLHKILNKASDIWESQFKPHKNEDPSFFCTKEGVFMAFWTGSPDQKIAQEHCNKIKEFISNLKSE
jgi:hypothetical protein